MFVHLDPEIARIFEASTNVSGKYPLGASLSFCAFTHQLCV